MLSALVPVAKTLVTLTGKKAPVFTPWNVTSSPATVVTFKLPAVPIYKTAPSWSPQYIA